MTLRQSRTPAHLQANTERLSAGLEALGLQADPEAMQGGERPGAEQDGLHTDPIPGDLEAVATVDPFRALGEEERVPGTSEDLSASQDGDLETGEGGGPSGLTKRELDARDAQRRMSKVQVKLDKTVEAIESMMSALGERQAGIEAMLQRLSTMRTTTGEIPDDITPASDEVMAVWKKDYDEALSVIDYRVAPLYASLSKCEARIEELVGAIEQSRRVSKVQEIETEVYSKIPKATLKRIVESDVFVHWFQDQSPEYQAVIRNAVEKTTMVHPKTTLKVFRDFSSDTGIQIPGLTAQQAQQLETVQMDTAPQPRGGVQPVRQRQAPANVLANTPLSNTELMDLKNTMARSTEAEKAILRQRLALTQINVNGDGSAQTLR